MTPEESLIEANRAFYIAFSRFDLGLMDDVWLHDDAALCVHPGWPALRGWPAIRESWARIFNGDRGMEFVLADVRTTIEGNVAHIDLVENVRYAGDSSPSFAVAARNTFRLIDGRWILAEHVAAPAL